jgi:hypothetical protein
MAQNKLKELKKEAVEAVKNQSKEKLQTVIEESVLAFRESESQTPEFTVTDRVYQELSDPAEREWLKRQVQKVPKIDYLIASFHREGYKHLNYQPKELSLYVTPRIVLALHEILNKPISERLKDRIEDVNEFQFQIEVEVIGLEEKQTDYLHIKYLPEEKTWSFPISNKYGKSLEIQIMNWEAQKVLREAVNNLDESKAQEVVILGYQNPNSIGLLPFNEVFEEVDLEGKKWLQEMLLRISVSNDLTNLLHQKGYIYGGGGEIEKKDNEDFYLQNLKLVAKPKIVKKILEEKGKVIPNQLKRALDSFDPNSFAFHIYPCGNEEGETFLVISDGDLKVTFKSGYSNLYDIDWMLS